MFGYGAIAPMIEKIQDRDVPEIFSHDYLRFTLGFARESDRAFIALAKRIGLLTVEGKPTDLYAELRKPRQAPAALKKAMQNGYATVYARNANAHELPRKELAALIAEVTGLEPGHATARAVVGTFLALRDLASPPVEPAPAENRRKVERRGGR
jgi:hypothetical protein